MDCPSKREMVNIVMTVVCNLMVYITWTHAATGNDVSKMGERTVQTIINTSSNKIRMRNAVTNQCLHNHRTNHNQVKLIR